MSKGLLDPKIDCVFKSIFRSEKHPESEKVKNLEMNIEEIRSAKDELIRMSNDEKERAIYDMRAKILKDKVSALNNAEKKGIEKGIEKAIEKMLIKGMDVETIMSILDVDNKIVERVKIMYRHC